MRRQSPPVEGPGATGAGGARPDDEGRLRDLLEFVRTRTGRDVTHYKRATVLRRVGRRMQVNGVDDLGAYLHCLRTRPGEPAALLQDLLISVTQFFRDAASFDALAAHVPAMFEGKGPGDVVRVWVVACATGEEAYSVAMLLSEYARTLDAPPLVQVFATDLDDEAVHAAREGIYPAAIEADVSEERLHRFFLKEHGGWRVRRELRERVLFATHDVLKDAPFSRLDLVTCRNLLIYLTRDSQQRVLQALHFGLLPHGRLMLGPSESVDESSPLFTAVDRRHRIYAQRPMPRASLALPRAPVAIEHPLDAQPRAREGAVAGHPGFEPTPEAPVPSLRETASGAPPGANDDARAGADPLGRHLDREIERLKLHLRDTAEQYEASMEELRASNEELQAMNEALRCATEELDTSREELQSINEELIAVNQELMSRVEQLSRASSDMHNLMDATAIATLFLDRDLKIKRFTPAAAKLFNLVPTDIGRPLTDMATQLALPRLGDDARRVLEQLVPVDGEVRQADGSAYLARLMPYRTLDDRIAGVVFTCVDITERKQAQAALRESRELMRLVVENVGQHAIPSTDLQRRINRWDAGARRILGDTSDEAGGRSADTPPPAD